MKKKIRERMGKNLSDWREIWHYPSAVVRDMNPTRRLTQSQLSSLKRSKKNMEL